MMLRPRGLPAHSLLEELTLDTNLVASQDTTLGASQAIYLDITLEDNLDINLEAILDVSLGVRLDTSLGVSQDISLEASLDISLGASLDISQGLSLEAGSLLVLGIGLEPCLLEQPCLLERPCRCNISNIKASMVVPRNSKRPTQGARRPWWIQRKPSLGRRPARPRAEERAPGRIAFANERRRQSSFIIAARYEASRLLGETA